MPETNKMICPDCGVAMNHHANKIDYGTESGETEASESELGGTLVEAHTCPECGRAATRPAAAEE